LLPPRCPRRFAMHERVAGEARTAPAGLGAASCKVADAAAGSQRPFQVLTAECVVLWHGPERPVGLPCWSGVPSSQRPHEEARQHRVQRAGSGCLRTHGHSVPGSLGQRLRRRRGGDIESTSPPSRSAGALRPGECDSSPTATALSVLHGQQLEVLRCLHAAFLAWRCFLAWPMATWLRRRRQATLLRLAQQGHAPLAPYRGLVTLQVDLCQL
jgi:hypothetical protein